MKTICLLLLMLAAATVARALEPKTFEQFGVQQTYSARVSATSTHTVSGLMTSWSVLTVGGGGAFHLIHATGTGTGFTSQISSTIYVTAGIAIFDMPKGLVVNPQLSLDALDAATTAYIDISYLAPRERGSY